MATLAEMLFSKKGYWGSISRRAKEYVLQFLLARCTPKCIAPTLTFFFNLVMKKIHPTNFSPNPTFELLLVKDWCVQTIKKRGKMMRNMDNERNGKILIKIRPAGCPKIGFMLAIYPKSTIEGQQDGH
jgi:hypothetical protein